MWHVLGRSECWWANLQERDHSEDRRRWENHMKTGTKNKYECYVVYLTTYTILRSTLLNSDVTYMVSATYLCSLTNFDEDGCT
jgi:hypothetical protein